MAYEYVLAITLAYAGTSGIQHTMPVTGTYASNSACLQAVTDAQEGLKRADPKRMVVMAGGTLCKPQEVRQAMYEPARKPGEKVPGQEAADEYKRILMESLARHTRAQEEANAAAAAKKGSTSKVSTK